MKKVYLGITEDELVKVQELMSQLEIIYPKKIGVAPPDHYGFFLAYSLWKNDSDMLMNVLDTQDINPWEIRFVEDGLSSDSPDQQSMVEFAARKNSWNCVAILIQHYFDCRQQIAIGTEITPTLSEYETAKVPERIAYLEAKMRAFNKGCAAFFSKMNVVDAIFSPSHSSQCPKSARFIFEDFSKIKLGKKKNAPPIESKRLDLHQKAFAAISAGDVKALDTALNILKINAVAYQAAKRAAHDPLTIEEINQFFIAALSCDYPECTVKIISKVLEFKKSESWTSVAGKKVNEENLRVLAIQDAKDQLELISNMAKDIDRHLSAANSTPAREIQAAIGNAMASVLITVHDMDYINVVKKRSEESLTVMMNCVNQACVRAASRIEKGEIENSLPANSEEVNMPRERVRL